MSGENPGQTGAEGGTPASPAVAAVGGGSPAAPGTEHPATVPWDGVEGVYKVGEGDASQPWWASIKEEPVREYMEAKQYANPNEAAIAAYNANKLAKVGEDAIIAPGKDATPEQWNDFYSKLGRPETPEGYEFKFDEGIKADEDMMNFGKQLFHELGASPEKAQAAADKWNEFAATMQNSAVEAERAANTQALDALVDKWEGEEKLNEMKAAGERAVKSLGLDATAIERIEDQIGSAPIVELLAMIGSRVGEGQFKDTGTPAGDPNDPVNMTAKQAQDSITKLQEDVEFQKAYTDKNHAGHKDALSRMEKLFAKANSNA